MYSHVFGYNLNVMKYRGMQVMIFGVRGSGKLWLGGTLKVPRVHRGYVDEKGWEPLA